MSASVMGRGGEGAGPTLACALACAALGVSQPACALQPDTAQPASLRDMLFGAPRRDDRSMSAPPVARYRGEAGASFVFERSTAGPALLRFEDSPEIWVLRPTPAPRGDVIYRDDTGQEVLRATRVGGLTLFTDTRPDGMAAWMAGQVPLLRPMLSPSPGRLFQVLLQASTRAGRAAQHLVEFDAPDVSPGDEPVFADAAVLTAEAFVQVAGRSRAALTRYVRVRFTAGRAPQAVVAGQEVRIVVVPRQGVAGRPSSRRIAGVITAR